MLNIGRDCYFTPKGAKTRVVCLSADGPNGCRVVVPVEVYKDEPLPEITPQLLKDAFGDAAKGYFNARWAELDAPVKSASDRPVQSVPWPAPGARLSLSDGQLYAILGGLMGLGAKDEAIDDIDTYSRFMLDLAELICAYAGGEVVGKSVRQIVKVDVRPNDSLPDDGGVWARYLQP